MFGKWKTKSSAPAPTGPVEFLVVGLGNPGAKYEATRHNAGFMAVDCLAEKLGVKIDRLKFKSLTADAMIGAHRVLLMKPSTFMNNSGEAVREAARFYKIPAERVLVLFDDVSLEPGRMRIRRQGSDGGHNGIKSIIYLLEKDTFPRIKIGVGKKPHPEYDLADWVLGKFPKELSDTLDKTFEAAAEAAMLIVEGKTDLAMNRFNS
ncbi:MULTISPECIES: aminoacyl-tRNA hydrolase [Anaerotruncus]|jgi:PTH1 family peptidyl-tRNA hydrolase|uniref:aminoacyl-tRNA hydrolase n=1 Tax=Anaerotruncus TaxID=244127 RepID=UPI000830E9F8|nr:MULTISPECIES: aminoacyl-tRNA hydrolase [Anaerotruncus]RGX56077.1 aminoacyl-tRNA hydrolase [Anaerotruncus sp. AF02-27]